MCVSNLKSQYDFFLLRGVRSSAAAAAVSHLPQPSGPTLIHTPMHACVTGFITTPFLFVCVCAFAHLPQSARARNTMFVCASTNRLAETENSPPYQSNFDRAVVVVSALLRAAMSEKSPNSFVNVRRRRHRRRPHTHTATRIATIHSHMETRRNRRASHERTLATTTTRRRR